MHVKTLRRDNSSALVAVVLVCAVAATSACGSKPAVRPEGIQTEARLGYLRGLVELQDGNYPQAAKAFNEVATSPRYFRYTALASLRVADTLFYQEQYAQAVTAYQSFIKRFAGNPNVPYAEFRIAESHFRRMPGDWWFMPPAHQKDLSTTRSAYDALRGFLARYPRHRFAPEAEVMRGMCAKRLYDHEMYVADFYESRDKPAGVALRLEAALADFPEYALTAEALLRLARAHVAAGNPKGARSALERYLAAFPNGNDVARVRTWLTELPEPAEEPVEGEEVPAPTDGATPPDDDESDDGAAATPPEEE